MIAAELILLYLYDSGSFWKKVLTIHIAELLIVTVRICYNMSNLIVWLPI